MIRTPAPLARCLAAALLVVASLTAEASQRDDAALRLALLDAIEEGTSFEDRFDAEVWLLDMSSRLGSRIPDPAERMQLLRRVHYEAHRVDLPPELVLAVIEVESAFDRWAISVAGAQGLMQVMPFWLDELGRPDDSLHALDVNVRFGCTILRHYLDIENGDLQRALARYNGSLGRVEYPNRVLDALRHRWYRR